MKSQTNDLDSYLELPSPDYIALPEAILVVVSVWTLSELLVQICRFYDPIDQTFLSGRFIGLLSSKHISRDDVDPRYLQANGVAC